MVPMRLSSPDQDSEILIDLLEIIGCPPTSNITDSTLRIPYPYTSEVTLARFSLAGFWVSRVEYLNPP